MIRDIESRVKPDLKSLYSDKQWIWLNEMYLAGHSAAKLAEFAVCARGTMFYNWDRLKLPTIRKDILPNLDKDKFNSLGEYP